jgi:hypothetical protein
VKLTSSVFDALICECGHQGRLRCRENNAPFSSFWESYSLDGFKGAEFSITSFKDRPKDILAELVPKCPKCGRRGKVKYAPRYLEANSAPPMKYDRRPKPHQRPS